MKKLKEDERKSIRILEQSFFVNEKAAIDDEIKMDPDGNHMGSHFCEECEISFNITSHFARYRAQRTEGRLNLKFQAHSYGIAFLNP